MFENISIGTLSIWTGWIPLSEYWTPCEWLWVHVNAFEWLWTAPEHPLSAYECQWLSRNSPWTPIECVWMPLSEHEHQLSLSAHEYHWVIIECNSQWCDHEKKQICVRIEQPLNVIECSWTPLSEYWTTLSESWPPPEHNWVCVNIFEWVLNMPWVLLNMSECISRSVNSPWRPIECAWPPLSKYFEGLHAHL